MKHEIPCYDFARYMPAEEEYWVDGRHLNERGQRLKARYVYDYLVKAKLLWGKVADKGTK